jgi:hypothetical protein
MVSPGNVLDRVFAAALLACLACGPHYAYTFQDTDPGVQHAAPGHDTVGDADLVAELAVDPAAGVLALALTNKTDQVLQVDWANITLTAPDGAVATLRPDADLGWLAPSARVAARLVPVALPRTGSAAAANDNARYQLAVPAIVRREPKVYRYNLVAHVRAQ